MSKNSEKTVAIDDDRFFQLLNIYLTEWCHRDNYMQKEIHTYFYAALIVILAPYIKIGEMAFSTDMRPVCYLAGFVLSLCVLLCGLMYGKRVSYVGDQYREMLKKLPDDYTKKYFIDKSPDKTQTPPYDDEDESETKHFRLAYIIPVIMAVCLVTLNIIVYHML